MPKKDSNPILKTVHGVPVRKYNYLNIMYSSTYYEELINESKITGLTIPVLLSLKSRPCQKCGCDNVTLTIGKNGQTNKQSSSITIIERHAKGHQDTPESDGAKKKA